MSQAKKIISDIAESVGEMVKDSAKQIAETVDPVKMMEQAAGIKKDPPAGGEFTKYLKDIGGNVTEAELNKRKLEIEANQRKEMEEAQKVIRNALPEHLRPRPNQEPSVFEKNKQEEEMRKAQMVEAQKKQQRSQLSAVQGKTTGKRKQRSKTSDFEASKNIKIG